MSTKIDIVNFLKSDPNIARLNFAYKAYKVYPSAYQKDVADAISSGEIKLGTAVGSGSSGSYFNEYDRLELSPSFSIANWYDQAYLVSERKCCRPYKSGLTDKIMKRRFTKNEKK